MAIDIFGLCKARLPELLEKEQEGNKRYIFVIDQPNIAEAIIAFGYNAIYISSTVELNEIIEILQCANMFANNCIIVGCCYNFVNEAISKAIGALRFINTGWKLYRSKKEYYELNTDELKPRIEAFINNITQAQSSIVLNSETGLISLKETGYKNVAMYIIDKYDIIMLDNELRIHQNGRVYKSYTEADNDDLLIDIIHNSKKRDRAEIFPYIRRYAPKHSITKNAVAFLNGVYDLNDKKLKPYTDNMYFCACIPHNYNEESLLNNDSAKIADTFFKAVSCDDFDIEKLLIDIIAYCFVPGNPWQKTFFIFGSGGNGKGTYFTLLTSIFGTDKVEFKSWQDLGTATGRASIINKLIVLCNDINDTFIKEPQALKTLISCEPQTVKYLYQNEFTAVFKGKIISSGNAIPRVNDTSHGWQRRLILIPFDADFRKSPDINMSERLTSEAVIEYIICEAMARLPKVLKEGFETPIRVNELIEEYRLENNPVALFLKECGNNFKGEENGKVLDTIYRIYYSNFCNENGYKALSKNTFAKKAKSAGLKKIREAPSEPFIYYV